MFKESNSSRRLKENYNSYHHINMNQIWHKLIKAYKQEVAVL